MRRDLRPRLSLLLVVFLLAQPGFAFTQAGMGYVAWGSQIPEGHEWLTRRGALEILGGDPNYPNDSKDPRLTWSKGPHGGLAQNVDLSSAQAEVTRIKSNKTSEVRYQSNYDAIYSAIIGDRWVDIGGFNVAKATVDSYNCFDAVAQNAADVQYDHYLRGYYDNGPDGGANAASAANTRFLQYFQDAATAPSERILVWDGGGVSQLVEVDLNYFLFGRALHLLQDSFSLDHAVRVEVVNKTDPSVNDNYTILRQVKSYTCAAGSEQHSHSNPAITTWSLPDFIWNSTPGFRASNMKPNALVAMEASKDAWAAFIRTMALPVDQRAAAAQTEAFQLVLTWLSFVRQDMDNWYNTVPANSTWVSNDPNATGAGSQQSCVQNSLGVSSGKLADFVTATANTQSVCLYNVVANQGYEDLNDVRLRMPYNWTWKYTSWAQPTTGWLPPALTANSGTGVVITNLGTKAPLGVASVADAAPVAANGRAALPLIRIQNGAESAFRVRYSPGFFLGFAHGETTYGSMVLQLAIPAHIPVGTAPVAGAVYLKDPSTLDIACTAAATGAVTANASCDPNSAYSQWTIANQ